MTEEEEKIALAFINIILDFIKKTGKRGIPSGHLYAMLMGKLDLETYSDMITILKSQGKIEENNYVLTSIA